MIDFKKSPKIYPTNTDKSIPRDKGICFWFDNETNKIVYIGGCYNANGLYKRIVKQHLDPEYLEDRESEHRDADSFQLSCNIIKKNSSKITIDKSAH